MFSTTSSMTIADGNMFESDGYEAFLVREGVREGLCLAALALAEELDSELYINKIISENGVVTALEESWWHSHNDDEGDTGSDERYKVDSETIDLEFK